MPAYVMRLLDQETGTDLGFLHECDFNANGPRYPTGDIRACSDPLLAMQFNSRSEAICYYLTISTSCPKRPDGKFNRPLTFFSVQVLTTKEAMT